MSKTITLSMQTEILKGSYHMAFHCDIESVKEGYMYIGYGKEEQDLAMWLGLKQVIRPLFNRYRDYTLRFAFPEVILSIGKNIHRDETLRMINGFKGVEFINEEQYQHDLAKVIRTGMSEKSQVGRLMGYKKEDLNKVKEKTQKKKVQNKRKYYDGFGCPDSGIVLDFETTSHIIDYARFIEISALQFKDGRIVDQYNTLVNPGIKIPKKIRELTNIKQEDVKDSPDSFKAIRGLLDFMKEENVIVGHNVAYDVGVLDEFCDRFNYPKWEGELLCTQRLAKKSQVLAKNYKLGTLCDLFGVTNENPHRAYSDTMATFEVMLKIYQTSLLV